MKSKTPDSAAIRAENVSTTPEEREEQQSAATMCAECRAGHGPNQYHALLCPHYRAPSAATPSPEELQAMIDVVTGPLPLPEGACPRCRGMNGYFVGPPDGVRVYVRCAECEGTGRAA